MKWLSHAGKTDVAAHADTKSEGDASGQTPKPNHQALWGKYEAIIKDVAPIFLGVVLFYLSIYGVLTQLTHEGILAALHESNQNWIAHSREFTISVLETLAVSDALISVLKSSSGGISFFVDVNLQLGEVLNPLAVATYDAARITVWTLAAIELIDLTLQISLNSSVFLLSLYFLSFSISSSLRALLPTVAKYIRPFARTLLTVVLVTHLFLPAALYSTSKVSEAFLSAKKETTYQGYKSLHATLPKQNISDGFHDQIEGNISHFKKNQAEYQNHASHTFKLNTEHFIMNVFEYMLFPLFVVLFLYAACRKYE